MQYSVILIKGVPRIENLIFNILKQKEKKFGRVL
jgi:hypothetical protein